MAKKLKIITEIFEFSRKITIHLNEEVLDSTVEFIKKVEGISLCYKISRYKLEAVVGKCFELKEVEQNILNVFKPN